MVVPSLVAATNTAGNMNENLMNNACNGTTSSSNNNINAGLDDTSATLLQSLLSNGFFTSQQQHHVPQDQMNSLASPMLFQNANAQTQQNGMFAANGGASTNANCALTQWMASQQSFAANVGNANQQDAALALSSSMLQQTQQQQQEASEPLPLPSMSWNNNGNNSELLGTQGNAVAPLSLQGMLMPSQAQQTASLETDLSPLPMASVAAAAVSDTDLDSSSSNPSATKTARFRRDQAEQWSERYDELLAFLKEHGHCRVPRNHKKYGALSSWVKRQRYQYKLRKEGKPSFLTDERVAVLDRLGFVWDSHGSVWETRFQELQEFHKQFGHSNVPYNYNNAKLASWIKAQRREMRAFKEGKTISPEMFQRFLKLEKYGFCWQLRSSGRKSQSKQAKAAQQQQHLA